MSRPAGGAVRVGLVLLGLLSLVDVAGLLLTDGVTPPIEVAAIGSVLGVVSLGLLVWFARRGGRWVLAGLLATRLVSAASAVPAFVVPDVPGPVLGLAVALVVLTLLGCGLVLPALSRAHAA